MHSDLAAWESHKAPDDAKKHLLILRLRVVRDQLIFMSCFMIKQ